MKIAAPVYNKSFKYLLALLGSLLSAKDPPKPCADTDWAAVYYLAREHSVLGMTCYAVEKLRDEHKPPKNIMQDFIDAKRCELILESNIQFETQKVLKEAQKAGIPLVLLKGFLIKNYYPVPSMRSMSDVDMLFRKSDKARIISLFKQLGYTVSAKSEGELDFTKDPFYHYELHTNLVSESAKSYEYFKDIFPKAKFSGDSCLGSLSASDHYIYILEHLARHLELGGAGLRMIMDIYVFSRAEKNNLDTVYIAGELDKIGLTAFCKKITALAENWFSTDDPDTDSLIADFILCSFTFGSSKNAIVQTSLRQEKTTGKKHSGLYRIFHHIFPKHSFLCYRFPSAKKLKLLYPFYVFAYWFLRVFKNRNINISSVRSYYIKTDSNTAKRLVAVMEDLGLSNRM